MEGPYLSAQNGSSRSDAGGSAAQSHEQFYDGMATMDYGWAAALADTDSAKILLDGMQHSVPALAARGKEADMLPPERRGTFSATEHFIHSLGQIIGDMPVYAVGGAAGSAGGPAGAAALSFATTEALRAYYLDAIRKGEIKSIDDVLRRLQASVQGAAHGATQGLGMATGAGLGAKLAARAGPTTAMLSQTLGELFGLNGASALIQGHFPSQEEFQYNATLLLGLKSAHRVGKGAQEKLGKTLEEVWKKTRVMPEEVLKDATNNPQAARSIFTEPDARTYIFAKTVESAAKHMNARDIYSYLRETNVTVVAVEPQYTGKSIKEIRTKEHTKQLQNALSGDYTNKQTGEKMMLSRGGVRHGSNSATERGLGQEQQLSVEHMEAVATFPSLAKNAVLGERHPNYKDGGLTTTSRYYALMKIPKGLFVVKITSLQEPGKKVGRAEIASIERIYDLSLAKKVPGSVLAATQASENPSGIVRRAPGTENTLPTGPNTVKQLPLFNVLEGLKESVEPKEQLLIEQTHKSQGE